jgi:PEGA domain
MRNIAHRVSSLSALGVFAGLLFMSPAASAGDVTLSVLGLEPAAGAPDAIASAVTEALRQRVTSSSGFRLVPGRDLVEVKLVFSCPDEAPPCMTQAAQSIGSAKVIFGSVQPVGTDAFIVTLKLLDAERGMVESWISEQITKAQASPVGLRAPVQKWFATLTGQAQPGTIKVSGGVVGAAVWLDGAQAGLMGADGLTLAGVAAGQHQITVSKTGYEKWDRNVTLASGGTEKVPVQLKAIEGAEGGAPAPEAVTPDAPVENEPAPAAEPANQGARIGAWAFLGLGLVSLGLGGYSSYQVSTINSNLDRYRRYQCASGGAVTCSADGKTNLGVLDQSSINYVKSQQSTGDTYSKLQWVGYGVGGAMLIASGVFIYHGYFAKPSNVAATKNRTNLIVLPSVGPGNVGALAYLSF